VKNFDHTFFLADGEPYKDSQLALDDKGRPCSLYSACLNYVKSERSQALEVLKHVGIANVENLSDDSLAIELYEHTYDLDTCTTLVSPVEVWLDLSGAHRVKVYEP
jgi:hypothetical protein